MDKKAQAGLEYLMTYGWAIVIIATIIGALVLVLSVPEDVSFSSSQPGKILVKGSSVSDGAATIKLQNITGGEITLTSLSGLGGNCKIAGQTANIKISPGGEFLVECDATADFSQPLSIKYKDPAGLLQSADITPTNAPENKCGNGTLDTGEVCDGTQGVPAGAAFSCAQSDCAAIKITKCTAITESKLYRLEQSISPQAGAGYCIAISAAGSKLDCKNLAGEINMQGAGESARGVSIYGNDVTVDGCKIKLGSVFNATGVDIMGNNVQVLGSWIEGAYNTQRGITTINSSNPTFRGNTVVLTDIYSYGISLEYGTTGIINISGNNLAGVTGAFSCGLPLGNYAITANPKNTCGRCFSRLVPSQCNAACNSGWTGC